MHLSYKKGIGFLASAFGVYVLEKIFALIESHLSDIGKFIVTTSRPILDSVSIILGIISGIIIILQFIHAHKIVKKELSNTVAQSNASPIISVEIKDKFWYPPEKSFNSIFYTINIQTLLKNIEERATTIHTVSISFKYKGKLYKESIAGSLQIKMTSGDSINQGFNFHIKEQNIQIDTNPTNVILKIEHTYGEIEQIIDEIPKLPLKFI